MLKAGGCFCVCSFCCLFRLNVANKIKLVFLFLGCAISAITFDILMYSKKLLETEYTPQQAEAAVEVQKEALSEVLETTLVNSSRP